MQILIYVLTMLMLFSIMAYVRIDSYRNFTAIRYQFEEYMTKQEREFFSQRATDWYKNTAVLTAKEKEDKEKQQQTQASSRLSLYPLVNKKAREEDAEQANQAKIVLKKLLELLYGKQEFYKKLEAKRPGFVDELIQRVSDASDKLSSNQEITAPADLGNLNLEDDMLNEAFHKMLKGAKKDKNDKDPDHGYPSLLSFVNVSKKSKLRVFLAPRLVLLAISGNPTLVDELLQTRKEIYNQLSHEPPMITTEDAEKQFRTLFQTRLSSFINEKLLDYSVSKTNPSSYE